MSIVQKYLPFKYEDIVMARLEEISLEQLHELRERTSGEIPRERVLAAIGRKQGDQISTLAERHGVVEKTIRNWLDRFENRPLEQAPYDQSRPGRPSKLSDKHRTEVLERLQSPPTELGYERRTWTSALLVDYISEEYGVEYSNGHARKLLNEASSSDQPTRFHNRDGRSG